MGSSTKSIPVYAAEIRDSDHEFKFQTEINKLEKSVLLELPNPEYENLQNSYQRLKDIKINDHDKKLELPAHIILGMNDYEFYLPHRPAIRESTETTKIRIVYDASAKPNKDSVSLNECLETGPPLQNLLWDILMRSHFRPILFCGDIEKGLSGV